MGRTAIIIGAGPAGLTGALELLERTDIHPIILEKSGDIGGLSKTVNYKGNRMDIGGHRFFSKSDRVMEWWLRIMPLDASGLPEGPITINYHRQSREIDPARLPASLSEAPRAMLLRPRLSRIYFLRKFFDYPISLTLDTLRKLGLRRTIGIALSYARASIFPRTPEISLEDFLVNRFGYRLYRLFFSDYTEKVWGKPCRAIPAEWGRQRIKGVSFRKAMAHAIAGLRPKDRKGKDLAQKDKETSLIDRFLYPSLGPGQLWEEAARRIREKGGEILLNQEINALHAGDGCIKAVEATDQITGKTRTLTGDFFISSMPIRELVAGLRTEIPPAVREVADGLQYRDFITVGVLLRQLTGEVHGSSAPTPLDLKDTWIYIQDTGVRVGRLQLYNNWSPYLVKDPGTMWIGMEYFCNKGDSFWDLADAEIEKIAISELQQIGLARREDLLDSTVLRIEKTYPAYFGSYDRFPLLREYLDRFTNLFLVGRNGMHKYNNSDHSMLTAMVAVDNIIHGVSDKANIWAINAEEEYHEESKKGEHGAASNLPVP
ncbi:MAG: NAD(P)/FAD-dependent oxidoreductase [Bacteroidota bacterium]|nr:NAD(P)/FAD-dependent oxidoreductase [Bacteroidota bacterium]MDP4252439.1 NAD(P)/FAD-dependent oxidoreductase [Bacteroidota bacterium]MDP4259334.1 NAD(P)/FAD-dependent oxidoreductase [Bacteroidota bacterium]